MKFVLVVDARISQLEKLQAEQDRQIKDMHNLLVAVLRSRDPIASKIHEAFSWLVKPTRPPWQMGKLKALKS